MAKWISKISQINLLEKSQIVIDSGLLPLINSAKTLAFGSEADKYGTDLGKFTEADAEKLQEVTPEAVKEWAWQAYSMQDKISYKGFEKTLDAPKMLPNIIDYGAPVRCCGLCGHDIRYGYVLRNSKNDNFIIVGSECITNYSVNVVGGDIGQQAKEVIRAAQSRLANEIKIEMFNQVYPNATKQIANIIEELMNMPINLAQELYEVRSAYWVDRKRDMQRAMRLTTGLKKNGKLNKKQLDVLDDLIELIEVELPEAKKRYFDKLGTKDPSTITPAEKARMEIDAKNEREVAEAKFQKIFAEFEKEGYKGSHWINKMYDRFKQTGKVTENMKTVINDQYTNYLKWKASKEQSQSQPVQEPTPVTAEEIKKIANVVVDIPRWVAKRNNILSLRMEGVIERESSKGIYFKGHATTKAAVCCTICGKSLDNKISRLIGVGPICSAKYGIERPSLKDLTPENVAALQAKIESSVFEGWLPKQFIQIMTMEEAMRQADEMRKEDSEEQTFSETIETDEESSFELGW